MKVFLKTYGCQMNERDSEIIYSMMMQKGYVPAQSYQEADLIIFNTCSVRKHAEDRVWGKLEELKGLKEVCPRSFTRSARKTSTGATSIKPIIGLVGCMGKAYGKEIFNKLSHVDFVCAPANIYDIPALVEKVEAGKTHVMAVSKKIRPLKPPKTVNGQAMADPSYREEKIRAWVNISQGCNNFCSYCIVPYVRGPEISRLPKDIIDEIKCLVDKGTKEITLLGQNVNSYQFTAHGSRPADKNDFVKLLEQINEIHGLERIRFMTSHPKDAGLELFRAIAGLDKVCEHIHLPIQSGSDRILKLMNRGYTVSAYLKLVESLRKISPGSAVTTDIIVGFPSESEKDFKDTYMLMKMIGFDSAFIFKYSARPFAKASQMHDDVALQVKKERNQILLDLQDEITKRKQEKFVGTIDNVLGISMAKKAPENSNDLSASYVKGRTRTNYQVVYKGNKHLLGRILDVRIIGTQDNTLIGDVV
jgi:tRNA-2-methylthio-N6-dimethylallyladenosine synthase